MAEDKYTWDDIVFNPNLYRVKDVINKKVYFADSPAEVLFNANKNIEIGILGSINVKDKRPFGIICNNCTFGYGCIIFKKEELYSEREKKWVEENDLKVGDYVKPLREAKSHENGWNAEWVRAMDDCVGKTLKVMSISPIDSSIILECNDAAYGFPYFVLEKVEPPKPKYVPFESAEEFIKAFDCYTHPDKDSEIKSILYMFGMWLKWKGEYVAVTHISDNGINDNTIEADWQDLCDNYTFLNGTPCGKEVKDE